VWYVVTNILDGYTVPVFRISAKMLVAIHKDYSVITQKCDWRK